MGLVLDWSNLDFVVLPFLLALTAAAFLALPLRRALERSRLPRAREPCVGCSAEGRLLRTGRCPEPCVVNTLGSFALALFVATTCLALFAYVDPVDLARFVDPIGWQFGPPAEALLALVVGGNAAAAVLVAAYLLQDLPVHRDGLLRGSATVSLGLMAVATLAPPALGRWVDLLLPLSLAGIVLGVGIEWRARHGRPAFGLRSLAVALLPLFVVTGLALVRFGQIVALGIS